MVDQATQNVNDLSTAPPQGGNLRTREDWLRLIIHGGHVTRIGQHLALVIYHLTDTTTNVATLSARDLEKITGWSKTVIVKHLREIHEFVHVMWGAGRAKSVFELQGVIANVMAAKKAERDAATPVATADAAKGSGTEDAAIVATPVANSVATTVSGTDVATPVAATQSCGNVVATKNDDVSPSPLKERSPPAPPLKKITPPSPDLTSHPSREERAPDWTLEEGCFAGQIFELSEVEYTGLQRAYGNLEFPAELVSADVFLADEFAKAAPKPGHAERMKRLHLYLNSQNRKTGELRRQVLAVAASKPRKSAAPMLGENADHSSCWVDETGLHLVNGYRADWLKKFDGNEERLEMAINEIAPYVKPNSPTPLQIQVNGKLGKIIGEKIDKDTRYSKAVKPEKGISRLKEKFLRAGE